MRTFATLWYVVCLISLFSSGCNQEHIGAPSDSNVPQGGLSSFAETLFDGASGEESRYLVAGHRDALPDREAVRVAGGTWIDEIPTIGVAVVSSNDPDFLERIRSQPSVWRAGPDFEVTNLPLEPMTVDAGQGEAEAAPPFAFLQWNHWAMNVREAHEAGHRGQGVRIAIIDGGIDLLHPEFEGQIDVAKSVSFAPGEGPWDGDLFHGTAVAGIVSARGIKILGVAPEATLVSVKVSGISGRWPISRTLQAIDYATAPEGGNARILNLSSTHESDQTQVKLHDVIESVGIANRMLVLARKRGAVVFMAAGNGVDNVGLDWREHPEIFFWFPPQAFVVGATGPCGLWFDGNPSDDDYTLITSYSNRGITDSSTRFIVAPGGQRRCIDPVHFCTAGNLRLRCNPLDMIVSTFPTTLQPPQPVFGSYAVFSGTSAAVPNASGLAALILSAEPHLSPGQLADRLIETALDRGDPGFDPIYGYGHVRY